MEYLAQFVHALFSPVNCVAGYGVEIVQATGHFVQCIGTNLLGAAQSTAGATTEVLNTVGTAASSIGG